MTLQNYWWLLIWLFIVGGFTFIISPYQEEMVLGRKCVRWHWLYAAILAAPYVVWAAWRTDRFGDTGMYRQTFNRMPVALSLMREYIPTRKGYLFALIEYLVKSIVSQSSVAFFFLIALLQIFFLVYLYRKYSNNFWLSMFLFVASTDYMAWMHNGMRQFLAATIIFMCIPMITKKKYLGMCVIVLLASLIHSSALVFFPFIFIVNGRAWNIRMIGFLVGIILAVLFLDHVTGFISRAMENTEYEGDIIYLKNADGAHIYRVLFYSVPAVMAFVFRPYIDAANDPMINVCANLSIVAAGFYVFSYFSSGILMGSIPIYFSLANYILIPWMINEVFEPSSAMLVNTVLVGTYGFFFYYQMGPTWGLF